MNEIPDWKTEQAVELFISGATIRQVMKEVKIARETAHRIQKIVQASGIWEDGKVRVNTGKRADGSIAFYMSSEMRPHWSESVYWKSAKCSSMSPRL